MAETIVGKKTYVLIWATLICLTVLTAGVSEIDLGPWNAPVALIIATTKASLVVMFFMHLRYEKQKVVRLAVLAGLFWLSILIVLSMADYATRGFLKVPGH